MTDDVPAPPFSEGVYVPNEIVLYGVSLTEIEVSKEEVPASEKLTLRVQLFQNGAVQKSAKSVLAAIYSYSFEGHCYRMDRPRIFLMNDVARSACNRLRLFSARQFSIPYVAREVPERLGGAFGNDRYNAEAHSRWAASRQTRAEHLQ